MEPRSVAKRLGVPHCRVSTPLNQEEVLREARVLGEPSPEARPEWAEIISELQPGDQLRMIDCVRDVGTLYFAHIRDDVFVTRMYTLIID
jgi:hypothetical protein